MKTSKPLTRNLLILVCLAVLTVCAVAGSSDRGQAKASSPQVQNRTTAIEVVSVTEQGASYRLRLRNGSTKAINGYSLGVGTRSKLDVDLTIGGKVIAPGGEFEESLNGPAPREQPVINVFAALFTDGTSDGDPRVIADNHERRAGTKAQLKQILPLLRAVLASDAAPDLVALKKQIAELPGNSERGSSHHFRRGGAAAKQDTVSRLEALAPDAPDTRRRLTFLVSDVEKRISRL